MQRALDKQELLSEALRPKSEAVNRVTESATPSLVTGDGRWIPTTSVDEYASTLARWFGVAQSDLPLVLPNLGRFNTPDLGFLG